MDTLTINLSAPQREFIEAKVSAGGYSSVSDYLAALVREAEKREAEEALAALIREAEESGPPVKFTPDEWESIWREAEFEFTRKHGR
jgi:antitoxin ParD1/3/4